MVTGGFDTFYRVLTSKYPVSNDMCNLLLEVYAAYCFPHIKAWFYHEVLARLEPLLDICRRHMKVGTVSCYKHQQLK